MTETTNREAEEKRPRPYRLTVRFTPEEFAHLTEQARSVHRSPANLLRHLGMSQRLKAVHRCPEDFYMAIKSFADNLNQLAHKANLGYVEAIEVEALRAEAGQLIKALTSKETPATKAASTSESATASAQ